jgi:hypothetical protein
VSQTSDSPSPIDEALKAGLSRHCIKWQSIAEFKGGSDKAAAEAAVTKFYELLEKPKPLIIWCDSPWQICAMKAALECGLNREDLTKMAAAVQQDSDWTQSLQEVMVARSLSQNVDASLWPKMWQSLDQQVSEKKQQELRQASDETKQSAQHWSGMFGVFRLPAGMLTKNSTWSWMTDSVSEWQAKLLRELHGVTEARLRDDKAYSQLRQQFETDFAANLNTDMQTQMRMELTNNMAFNLAQTMAPEDLRQPTGEPSWFDTVRDIGDGLSSLVNAQSKYNRELGFYSARLQAAVGLRLTPPNLDWLPFFEHVIPAIPSIPCGPTNLKRLETVVELYKHAFGFLFLGGICFICDPPIVFNRDDLGRLHGDTTCALQFRDGQTLYSWHGTTVPRDLIEAPVTVGRINTQWNAELRRVMIERYGMVKYLADSGAVKVNEDECGILYRKEFVDDEPLVMVKVKNSTAEPDGSFRDYFLRVPPNIATAREAVAWTFEMRPSEYKPKSQT